MSKNELTFYNEKLKPVGFFLNVSNKIIENFLKKRQPISGRYIFFFLIMISCNRNLNPNVEQAVLDISKEKSIVVDFIFTTSEYENLMKVASTEDLIFLTNHENANVRFFSFIGLMDRKYPKINEIYDAHKNDSTEVWVSNGACMKNQISLISLMQEAISDQSLHSVYINKYHTKNQKTEHNQYNVKDTISEIRISHKEGTEYLDAFIESGKLYIPKSTMKEIDEKNKIRENRFEPSRFDLYLTGNNNISEELFGKDFSSSKTGNEYIIKGQVIGLKHSSFLFRVDSYKKIELK